MSTAHATSPSGGRSRPLIGVTCYFQEISWSGWTAEAILNHATYARALERVDCRAVMLTPDSTDDDLLDRLDGIVISGGADVDPEKYGESAHEETYPAFAPRDDAEIAWVRRAHAMNLPLLGVCRGLQVMAVAFGGSLVQHMPEHSPLVHQERPGAFVHHDAVVEDGTVLASIIGAGRVRINSSHHQCVRSTGGLPVNALAEDGTIEGCEDPARDFFLGVQCHPEESDELTGTLIFGALAKAARAYRRQVGST